MLVVARYCGVGYVCREGRRQESRDTDDFWCFMLRMTELQNGYIHNRALCRGGCSYDAYRHDFLLYARRLLRASVSRRIDAMNSRPSTTTTYSQLRKFFLDAQQGLRNIPLAS